MSSPYNQGYGQPPIYRVQQVNYGWIGEAWAIYRTAWIPWLVLFIFPVAIYLVVVVYVFSAPQMRAMLGQLYGGGAYPGIIPQPTASYNITSRTLEVIRLVINFLVACCASDIALRQVRGEKIAIKSIFRGMRNWVQMLVFCMFWVIGSLIALLCCCVGIYIAYGLLIPGLALVADGESAASALSRSVDSMKTDWLNAAVFMFVLHLIIGFGSLLTCTIGAFALFPLLFIISALAYRDMIGMPGNGGSGWVSAPAKPSPWQQYSQLDPGQQQPGVWPPAPSHEQPPRNEPNETQYPNQGQ